MNGQCNYPGIRQILREAAERSVPMLAETANRGDWTHNETKVLKIMAEKHIKGSEELLNRPESSGIIAEAARKQAELREKRRKQRETRMAK